VVQPLIETTDTADESLMECDTVTSCHLDCDTVLLGVSHLVSVTWNVTVLLGVIHLECDAVTWCQSPGM